MKRIFWHLFSIILIIFGASIFDGCSTKPDLSNEDTREESNALLALNEQYDNVRNGARLILAYNAQNNAFKGTVENTTTETLKQVRVEIHLSNGVELGPTPARNLGPGEKRDIVLVATGTDFTGWTAHPEVGSGEHSHGEHGEHDKEGGGEHN